MIHSHDSREVIQANAHPECTHCLGYGYDIYQPDVFPSLCYCVNAPPDLKSATYAERVLRGEIDHVTNIGGDKLVMKRKPKFSKLKSDRSYFDDLDGDEVDEDEYDGEDYGMDLDPNAYWVDGKGNKYHITEMSTGHLSNVVNYLYRTNQKHPKLPLLEAELMSRPNDTPPSDEESDMKFNTQDIQDKLLNRFFRKVDNVVWDLSTGNIGVKNRAGDIVTFIPPTPGDPDNNVSPTPANVSVNMFSDFGLPIPAFAQNTPVADLKPGDLIVGEKDVLGWIVEKKVSAFRLMKPDGTNTQWTPPKVQTIGFDSSGAMVLRSLVNMTGGADGLSSLQANLMPLLMMGGMGDGDLESILPMMLFSQSNGAGGSNGMGNMMQTIMMMKMLGGKSGGRSGQSGGFFG